MNVQQAFAAVMDDVQAVKKTGHNSAQNFSFRGIDGVMNAVGPALRKHGVVIVPTLEDAHYRDIEVGQKRTAMREVTVRVRYTIYGPEGDSMVGSAPGESMDSGDKGTAKAMSVAYRTFLLQALTIPTEDADPDEHSYERAPAQPEPRQSPAPEGFADHDDSITQHDDLAETVKASGARDHMKAWREANGIPWPMTKAQLDAAFEEVARFNAKPTLNSADDLPDPEAPFDTPNELEAKARAIASKARAKAAS